MTIRRDLVALGAELRQAVEEAPQADLPEFLAQLEGAKARALARLVTPRDPAPTADLPRLVDASEMARLLMVSEHWVRDNARRGRIPSLRLGHYRRYNPRDVVQAVQTLGGRMSGSPQDTCSKVRLAPLSKDLTA